MGRSPRRFDVTGTSLRPILTDQAAPATIPVVKEPTLKMPRPVRSAPGFAEPKPAFRTVTPRRDAPYLRLVKSDD
jgi:hypothetical protein